MKDFKINKTILLFVGILIYPSISFGYICTKLNRKSTYNWYYLYDSGYDDTGHVNTCPIFNQAYHGSYLNSGATSRDSGSWAWCASRNNFCMIGHANYWQLPHYNSNVAWCGLNGGYISKINNCRTYSGNRHCCSVYCTKNGTQRQVGWDACDAPCSSYTGASCGNCGTRQCNGSCTGQGVCTPNDTRCHNGFLQTCTGSCGWINTPGINADGDSMDIQCGDSICDNAPLIYDDTKENNENNFCSDGLDNDCDGTMDCADSDCTTSPNCGIDIGLRFYDGDKIVKILVYNEGILNSPLRISKNGVIYSILLVDTEQDNASDIIVHTKDGLKALVVTDIP